MENVTTIDGLLNQRIKIEQPKEGYRVAVDTLLLAAAVPARSHDEVLELGCGVGGAMLALACRVPGVRITGIEFQHDLARLCLTNIERNAMHTMLKVMTCNATTLPVAMEGAFDYVMMNPPYHDEARHNASAHESKALANTEAEGDLALWVGSAMKALKPKGILTLIHRADRMVEIMNLLKPGFGSLIIKPIITKPGGPPKRVIIRAEKGAAAAQKLCVPLVLHTPEGPFTAETEAILRDVMAVHFA